MKRNIELIAGFLMGIICSIFGMVMFFEIKPEYAMYDNFDPEALRNLSLKLVLLACF